MICTWSRLVWWSNAYPMCQISLVFLLGPWHCWSTRVCHTVWSQRTKMSRQFPYYSQSRAEKGLAQRSALRQPTAKCDSSEWLQVKWKYARGSLVELLRHVYVFPCLKNGNLVYVMMPLSSMTTTNHPQSWWHHKLTSNCSAINYSRDVLPSQTNSAYTSNSVKIFSSRNILDRFSDIS